MSFEGYEQRLCKNGHYETFDVYEFVPEDDPCSVCGAKWVWFNLVDCTNEPGVGKVELEIATPARYETTCEACGSQAMVEEETYKIPLG
jgi:hypothetical protein